MCDPITMLVGAVSAASAVGMGRQKAAAPPTPAMPPAISAPISKTPEPEVKLGSDPDETLDTRIENRTYQRKRVSANTFGNLGKSALTI